MKFEYPSDDINDENAHKSLGSTNQFGFFPVSLNNSWHGGVHIEGWWEKIFAIADGEIIAYKLPKEYCDEVIGNDKYQYSNGFVLIRHNYKSPKEQELTFFSLYMHLLPKKSLMAGGAIVPSVFTNRGTVVEGLSAKRADGKTRSEAFVIPEGETVTLDTNPGNEVNDPDHWVKKAKAESKFQKVKFLDKNNHLWKEIYIATAGKYVEDLKNGQFKIITKEDKGHAPENYSFNIKELDKVVNCHILVKAGNLIGYTAKNGFGKQPNYRASHVEVFTAQDPTNFLNDAKDDGKDEKNYFKVKEGAILKKAYPGKIPGNGQLKVKNGEGFSQVQLISLTRTVLRADLEPYEKIEGITHYHIKTGTHFNNVFAAFDKKVNQSSILIYVSESVENGVQKRKVKYLIVPEAKKYWIANGEVPDGTDELRDFTDELTTIYEHKPVANHLQDTVSKEVIVAKKGVRNVKGPDNKQWYYLEIGSKSGWIKEGSDCEAISAYNWIEFGYNTIEDKEDLFIYDPKSPPKFMKDIWAHMDTEIKDGKRDSNLTAWELRNAYSKPVLAQKLSKMVCKHTSEWAWIDQWGTFKPKVKELYKEGIKQEEDGAKRKELETKRDQAIDALEIRLKNLCFWKEVKTAKPLGQDPEQFTSGLAVATGLWGNNYVALPPEKPKTQPAGSKDFPTDNPKVYHFHPVAFVQQMRRMKRPNVIEIYHTGHISKTDLKDCETVCYEYYDKKGNVHDLGEFKIVMVQKWSGGFYPANKPINGTFKEITLNNKTRYYLYDGANKTPLITPYIQNKNSSNKIFSYKNGNVNILVHEGTTREYHNPEAFATILGAIAEGDFTDLVCNGSVDLDGTGYPSVSHVNGVNTDFKYLRLDRKKGYIDSQTDPIDVDDPKLDNSRMNNLLDSLFLFGWGVKKKNLSNKTDEGNDLNHSSQDVNHKDHLHIQGLTIKYL